MKPGGARRSVRLVSRREFVERIRDRGFQISTGITLLILVGLIVANSFTSTTPSYELAVAGPTDLGHSVIIAART
jgi:hypothetical protein